MEVMDVLIVITALNIKALEIVKETLGIVITVIAFTILIT